MKASLKVKLDQLLERYDDLAALLSDSETIADQNLFRGYSKEYAEIEPVVLCYRSYEKTDAELAEARLMASDSDPEIRAMADDELQTLEADITALDSELQRLLLPQDPNDSHNIFLEIRAGTGGDEAALFAGDLFRMYHRYVENNRWQVCKTGKQGSGILTSMSHANCFIVLPDDNAGVEPGDEVSIQFLDWAN